MQRTYSVTTERTRFWAYEWHVAQHTHTSTAEYTTPIGDGIAFTLSGARRAVRRCITWQRISHEDLNQ